MDHMTMVKLLWVINFFFLLLLLLFVWSKLHIIRGKMKVIRHMLEKITVLIGANEEISDEELE